MDKFKFLIIIIIIFIFAEGAGLIYFAQRSQKLKQAKPEVIEKIVKTSDGYKDKYDELFMRFKAVEKDRNNLLVKSNRLMREKSEARKPDAESENLRNAKRLFDAEQAQFEKEKLELMAELDSLKIELSKVAEDKNRLNVALDGARLKATESVDLKSVISGHKRDISTINKGHKKEIDSLKREKKDLEKVVSRAEKESRKSLSALRKSEKRVSGLRVSLDEYKDKFIDAEKKNKDLAKEVGNIPKKFSELARQNKNLIKETAQMHYNLGVFYTNSLEYKRAIAEFEKAAEINPKDAHSHFNLGYIYAEYMVDRKRAIEHFRYYLRYAGRNDKDVDWVKKYLLTWETFEGMKEGARR